MVSERMQRQIDRMLDEAEEALSTNDWQVVRQRAQAVLAIEPGNADVLALHLAAEIGGSATGGEILVSSLLAQLVGPSGEFTLSGRPSMGLKGLDGEHGTHRVEWR